MIEIENYIKRFGLEKFLLIKQMFGELMEKRNRDANKG